MWLLDQLEPGSPTYHISHALRLSGTLEVEALKRSLKEIVSRHEALRTTFAAVDGEPVQVISPAMDTKLPVEDLSGLPQAEREAEAKRLARGEAPSLRPGARAAVQGQAAAPGRGRARLADQHAPT